MERMTFYIPPVFLFGNKVRHNQEENKAEYKTAAETEIKIENWNIKRIAELEEENKNLKEYNGELIENHKKDIAILCEENKKLKEKLQWWKDLVQKAKEFEYDEDGMDYIWQNTKI